MPHPCFWHLSWWFNILLHNLSTPSRSFLNPSPSMISASSLPQAPSSWGFSITWASSLPTTASPPKSQCQAYLSLTHSYLSSSFLSPASKQVAGESPISLLLGLTLNLWSQNSRASKFIAFSSSFLSPSQNSKIFSPTSFSANVPSGFPEIWLHRITCLSSIWQHG